MKTTSNLSQTVYPLYTFPADSTQTSYVWTVDKSSDGSLIPAGNDYKIQVVVVASSALGATTVALDESDSFFTITSGVVGLNDAESKLADISSGVLRLIEILKGSQR